jgi:hypothetical protein
MDRKELLNDIRQIVEDVILELSYFKKGKFLYFKRSELKKWIEDGKQFYREG